MKNFTKRVKRNQEKQGLHVIQVAPYADSEDREPIDLIAMKNGKVTFIRARGNGHGKLRQYTRSRLQALGRQCGSRVLNARVNGENEICFDIIYEKKRYTG